MAVVLKEAISALIDQWRERAALLDDQHEALLHKRMYCSLHNVAGHRAELIARSNELVAIYNDYVEEAE